jgi:hypothetical protein
VCCRSTTRPVSLLNCRTEVSEPRSRTPANGINSRKLQTPHAFHEFDEGSCSGQLFVGHHSRGAHLRLSPSACPLTSSEHPSARRMTRDPVRADSLHRRSTLRLVPPLGFPRTRRQDASNPLLQPTFHVTSTRRKHHLWRPPAVRRGETPPASVSRSSSLAAFPPMIEKDAGPPCGHPASSSHVLDGTPPASGRPALTCAFRAMRSRARE